MTPQPPWLATALLRRCCPSHDALLGDLMEAHATGRSSWWYWRETLVALLVCTVADIGQHGFLAARAVVSAWVLSWAYFEYAPRFLHADEYLFVTGLAPWLMPVILRSWWVGLAIGWFLCGWFVSRLHRPYGFAVVMLCVMCGFVSRAGQYVLWAMGASSDFATVAGIVAAQASYVGG